MVGPRNRDNEVHPDRCGRFCSGRVVLLSPCVMAGILTWCLMVVADFGPVFCRRCFQARIRLALPSFSQDSWLAFLSPSSVSSAIRNLKTAAVHRRSFMTIVLPLHRFGELIHRTLSLWSNSWDQAHKLRGGKLLY